MRRMGVPFLRGAVLGHEIAGYSVVNSPVSPWKDAGMVVALLASEYAHSPTILATFAACAVIPAVVGRPWTLLLPVALIVSVLAAGLSSWVYERVPEDIQAGIFIGAGCGLVAGTLALLARQWIARLRAPGAGAGH
jgi:hypothetical protein